MSKNGWRDACVAMIIMNIFLLYSMYSALNHWKEKLDAKPKIIHTCQEENGQTESD